MTDDEDAGTAGVDQETVEHIAALARIDLDADEREQFAAQFSDILAYFETLDEVPAVDREANLSNVMRADEVGPSLDREDALRNAAETEAGHFKGPKVS